LFIVGLKPFITLLNSHTRIVGNLKLRNYK